MFIALTGTPGTGKTTVAALLQKQEYNVLSINDIAKEQGFIVGKDEQRDTQLVDMGAVNDFITKNYASDSIVIIEGHSAHLLECVKKVIILRCHPDKLRIRLGQKNWSDQKIHENVEAEALDVILSESVENFKSKDCFEIDTTDKSAQDVRDCIQEIIDNDFTSINTYTIGQIDWLEEYLNNQHM